MPGSASRTVLFSIVVMVLLGHDPRLALHRRLDDLGQMLISAANSVLLIHTSGCHAEVHGHIVVASRVLVAIRPLTRMIRLLIHVLAVGAEARAALLDSVRRQHACIELLHDDGFGIDVARLYLWRSLDADRIKRAYLAGSGMLLNLRLVLEEKVVFVSWNDDGFLVLSLVHSKLLR